MKTKKNQKQVSVEEYTETYCQERRIRDRIALYISKKTHKDLQRVVWSFRGEHHTTTASLAEAIISHHLEAHKELLDEAWCRYINDDRQGTEARDTSEPAETDSESCLDDDSE